MNAINLTKEQIKTVQDILRSYLPSNSKVWIFGSRVTNKAKPYSDIDLVIDLSKPLSLELQARLANSFEDSTLPYKVDIVDWYAIDESFRALIASDCRQIL